MTKKQKEKINELKNYIKDLKEIRDDLFLDRDDWKKMFIKFNKQKEKEETKKQKICNYCGNPINKKPESKRNKNKRVMKGINELKRRGILSR